MARTLETGALPTAPAPIAAPVAAQASPRTRALLGAGVVAGPLFAVSYAVQATVRDGFDVTRHPISALSVGDAGWVQILTFVAAGLLVLAAAAGLRRTVGEGRGARWGSRLVAAHGLGLIAAGVFTTDPADGFPIGTPPGLPATFTWHAQVHNVVSMLAFAAIVVAAVVLARSVGQHYGPMWRTASLLVPVAVAAAMAAPAPVGMSLRLALASFVVLGWLAAVSAAGLRPRPHAA